jgi:hypothetical protein
VLVVNIGDTYCSTGGHTSVGESSQRLGRSNLMAQQEKKGAYGPDFGMSAGEPVGIPDMLKNALRADGWRHRDTVIWAKPAPMPGSMMGWRWEKHRIKVKKAPRRMKGHEREQGDYADNGKDFAPGASWIVCPGCPKCLPHGGYVLRKGQWRTTSSHDVCFMFVKSDRYFADAAGVKEAATGATLARNQYSRVIDDPDEQYAVAHDHEFTGDTRNPRSVQTWGPEPCKFSHYASFPSALPRFFIKAATSPKGCCPTCGTPWSPIIERSGGSVGHSWHDHENDAERGQRVSDEAKGRVGGIVDGDGQPYRVDCLGYRPSCSCPPLPSVPCRVLDPYAGTATTLQAALELGCEADGIELNPQYVQYAIERLSAYLVPKGQAPAVEASGPLFGEHE